MTRTNTCRYCGRWDRSEDLVRYSTRAYAHPGCLIRGKSPYQVHRLILTETERKKLDDWVREEKEKLERL